jgi:hypothetical protein
MTNTLQISQLTKHLSTDNMYNFLLGITSDGLYILNMDKTLLLEVIVDGNSNDCTVCSTPNEDAFLDAILFIKKVLKNCTYILKRIHIRYGICIDYIPFFK